jgi:hypothetical protein
VRCIGALHATACEIDRAALYCIDVQRAPSRTCTSTPSKDDHVKLDLLSSSARSIALLNLSVLSSLVGDSAGLGRVIAAF